MIEITSDEVLQTEKLSGRYFNGLTCSIRHGAGMLVLCQQQNSAAEFIDIVCGIEVAHAGTCRLNDEDWEGVTQQQWKERSAAIGFATGEAEMIHNLRVWENLILPLQACAHHHTPPFIDHLEAEILKAFQAAGFKKSQIPLLLQSSPDSLSHFEQTVCGLIRCHLSGFEILVGQQLFAEIDPDHSARLVNLMNWLGKAHPTSGLLLVHHGSRAPKLSQLSCWQPIQTQTLDETP